MATESDLSQTFSDVLHDKALRKAFYNVAAILFTSFVGGIAVAIYYILQPFLRPMLWALLCGSFVYPFKHSIAHNSKVWLNKMSSSNTPLFIGFIILPFVLVNSLIDTLRNTLYKNYKIFIGGILFFVSIILFASLWPFDMLFILVEKLFSFISSMLEYLNGYMIATVVLGHIIVVALLCNSKTKLCLQAISIAIWIIVIFYFASVKGPFAVFLGIVITLLGTGGSLVDIIRSRINSMRGQADSRPVPAGTMTSRENLDNTLLYPNQDGDGDGKLFSDQCLLTLIWCIIILQLWMHGVLVTIGIIMLVWIAIQSLGHKYGFWSHLRGWFATQILKLKEKVQSDERFHVFVPRPIRMFFKMLVEGDAKALQLLESSADKICSALIIFLLLVSLGLFAIFTAFEVHNESMHLIRLTSNAFNETSHPDLAKWLPEGDVLQETLDSMVKNAYVYGRESIGRQIGAFLNGDETSTKHIEKQVLKLWDTLYNSWLNSNNLDQEKSISFKELGVSYGLSDLFNITRHANISFITIAKENVDLFMSVIKSIWSVIVNNLALTVKIITSLMSIILGGGAAIFNSLLSMVIFLSTLFYLLASSGDQYTPVKMFSNVSPRYFYTVHNFRVGKAFQDAIGSVFMVSCKMAIFYGLYTWFTHSLLGIQIVFIPSVMAAIFAAVPFVGTYVAAIPAFFELWLVNGQPYLAILLAVAHYLPTFYIDTAFYSEMKGGHPYVTGLAILGGMYWMGLEGAILGPILVCCFVVAMRMYQSIFQPAGFNQ